MAEFAGSALSLTWVHAGGTVSLHSDFRRFSTSPTVALYDASAGADAYRSYLAGIKDATLAVELVGQASGSALLAALQEGVSGTLNVGPEGTASGKPKHIFPAISLGVNYDQPYDDVVTLNVSFQQTGTPTWNSSF